MPVLEGNAHVQCVVPIIDQFDFALEGQRAVRVVIRQAENSNAAVDAAVFEDHLVAADIGDSHGFLDQCGVDSQAAFLDLLFGQASAHDTSLLMVSHDPRLEARFDRVLRLEDIARIERAAA